MSKRKEFFGASLLEPNPKKVATEGVQGIDEMKKKNKELEEKNKELHKKNKELEEKNKELHKNNIDAEEKYKKLSKLCSDYKNHQYEARMWNSYISILDKHYIRRNPLKVTNETNLKRMFEWKRNNHKLNVEKYRIK